MGETKKFGTFSGVFMPSVLAILGAVMYFIAPQVVGGVGLLQALAIILIAHSVTIATAFSISAIATNINVRGGGMYYLISRSLGSEFGGSLGIQLYLAQTIASSFYAMAFARGISTVLVRYSIVLPEYQIALISLGIFGVIVFIGANFVVKLQYLILGAILLSLGSIFLGPQTQTISEVLLIPGTMSFWIAFAMFFPAVTGIDAGVGMSGELKDPKKSLVKGTFIAIFLTMAIYIAMTIKYAFSAAPADLVSNPNIAQQIAIFSPLVLLGIIMATSSSALSSMMTAPRALTAMVRDRILPRWMNFLGNKVGKSEEPRVAILFSLAIGLCVIMLGSLEFVSQIVSMFFLSVYGWINGAAFFEKLSQNPSYRPTFNAPAIVSFYGMFAAYAIMYLFEPGIMLLVIFIQLVLFLWLYRSKKSMKLESVWDGVFFQLLRQLLKRIDQTEKSKKNWRPTIMAFCADTMNKDAIASVLHWIGERRSLTKLYFLIQGDIKHDSEEKDKSEDSLEEYIDEHHLEIFPHTILSNDFELTIDNLMQAESLGNLPLNTVLIDFDRKIKIDKLLSNIVRLNKNVMILRNQAGFSHFKRVDVWWSSAKNGNLSILLAYLITHSKQWLEQGASIRIFKVLEDLKTEKEERKRLEDTLADSRIENFELKFLKGTDEDMPKIISEHSEHADLVILGIPKLKKKGSQAEIISDINDFTQKLKVSLLVYASDRIDFKVN